MRLLSLADVASSIRSRVATDLAFNQKVHRCEPTIRFLKAKLSRDFETTKRLIACTKTLLNDTQLIVKFVPILGPELLAVQKGSLPNHSRRKVP
jgi:hypothetical protein